MIAALLDRTSMTLVQAAKLCGVTTRTMANWRDGKSRVPAEALALLEAAAADVEIESAEPMTLAERIAVLRHIQQEQHHRCCVLEDDLAQARRDLGETARQLNALLAERGRQEQR